MKPHSVRWLPQAMIIIAALLTGLVTAGNDDPVTISPEPLKVQELGVLGKALSLRWNIACENDSSAFRVRFEMYREGKGPKVLWDGRVPVTTDGKGNAKVLITLQELPPRAVWDPDCAAKAPEGAREFHLASVNGELAMLPVPSPNPGQVWSWRGSGSQKHAGQGYAVLAVGVLDKVFPRLPLGWEKDSEALKRIRESRCSIVVRGKVE